MIKKIASVIGQPISVALNVFFGDENSPTKRPLGINILTENNHNPEFKVLLDSDVYQDLVKLFPEMKTGMGGLVFPEDKTPPIGSEVSYFYDPKYNVTGWNWKKIGETVPNQFNTIEEANAQIKKNDEQKPIETDNNFAEIGKEYFVKPKVKLILPTRENAYNAQVMRISQNGKIIAEYNRPEGWNSESSYWGNHPLEWQPCIENGTVDFYFKNTGKKPVIVGCTTGDKYAFYTIKGQLAKTNFWKRLAVNEEISFSQNLTAEKYGVLKDWTGTKTAFRFNTFFYENGVPTTDKVICLTRENGLEITNEKETYKFYKESNPSKNITIEFKTRGENQDPSFAVLHKQGLDIKPSFVGLTCFDVKECKVFNNLSEGYVDSPDYLTA
jgi:hypothetical protein